ncbi:MAG TPA: hypothetical protein VIG88_12440, partial [Lysobacter sp.]
LGVPADVIADLETGGRHVVSPARRAILATRHARRVKAQRAAERRPPAPGYNARPSHTSIPDMIELNPVRQRIADLRGRLDSLRGYL